MQMKNQVSRLRPAFWAACLLCLALLPALLGACSKADLETSLNNQDKAIDQYLKGLGDKADTILYRNGTCRAVMYPGVGDTLAPGDSLFCYYAAYQFNNGPSGLFDTNVDSLARAAGLTPALDGAPLKGVAGRGQFIQGLDDGLVGMRVGETAYLVFNAERGYGNRAMGILPKLTPLFFQVLLIDMKKQ